MKYAAYCMLGPEPLAEPYCQIYGPVKGENVFLFYFFSYFDEYEELSRYFQCILHAIFCFNNCRANSMSHDLFPPSNSLWRRFRLVRPS